MIGSEEPACSKYSFRFFFFEKVTNITDILLADATAAWRFSHPFEVRGSCCWTLRLRSHHDDNRNAPYLDLVVY